MSRLYTITQWKIVQYFVWAESAKIMLSLPEFSAYIGKYRKVPLWTGMLNISKPLSVGTGARISLPIVLRQNIRAQTDQNTKYLLAGKSEENVEFRQNYSWRARHGILSSANVWKTLLCFQGQNQIEQGAIYGLSQHNQSINQSIMYFRIISLHIVARSQLADYRNKPGTNIGKPVFMDDPTMKATSSLVSLSIHFFLIQRNVFDQCYH